MPIFRKKNFSQNFVSAKMPKKIQFHLKKNAQGCKPGNIQILNTE